MVLHLYISTPILTCSFNLWTQFRQSLVNWVVPSKSEICDFQKNKRDPTKIRTNRTRRTTHRTTQNPIFVLILVCLLNTFFHPATFLSIFVLILVYWLPSISSSQFVINFHPYFSILATTIFVLPFCYHFSSLAYFSMLATTIFILPFWYQLLSLF